jgi:hypothetical protein
MCVMHTLARSSRWFVNSSLILFLNKADLFAAKLAKGVPINTCAEFADYDGGLDYDECAEYIQDQFVARIAQPRGTPCALLDVFWHAYDAMCTFLIPRHKPSAQMWTPVYAMMLFMLLSVSVFHRRYLSVLIARVSPLTKLGLAPFNLLLF